MPSERALRRRARYVRVLRRHPRLVGALALATLLALVFAIRLVAQVAYWSQHREEPISGWMTAGYVGRSWSIPPRMLDEAAGLPLPEGRPLTLAEIARRRGVPVSVVIAEVEIAVERLRAEQPRPPAP